MSLCLYLVFEIRDQRGHFPISPRTRYTVIPGTFQVLPSDAVAYISFVPKVSTIAPDVIAVNAKIMVTTKKSLIILFNLMIPNSS